MCGPQSAKGGLCTSQYNCQGNLQCYGSECTVREGVPEVPAGGIGAGDGKGNGTTPDSSSGTTAKPGSSADAATNPDSSAGTSKDNRAKKGGSKLPIIAGAVGGGLAALALLGLACFCLVKKRRGKGSQDTAVGPAGGPDGGETWVDMMRLDMPPVEVESAGGGNAARADGAQR
jgi:hypothetical protein